MIKRRLFILLWMILICCLVLLPAIYATGSQYADQVLLDAPESYYRLGESDGTTATDSSTHSHDGTYNSVTLGAAGALLGDSDTAATFDGINDYVSLPTLELGSHSFSIEAWIKPATSPPAGQIYFAAYSASESHQLVLLTLYDSGNISFSFYSDDLAYYAGAGLFGAWHHLVLVEDYANDQATMYYDGAQVAQGSNGPFTGAAPTLWIGSRENGVNAFKGDIDEVAIYLSTLTAAQVALHYTKGTSLPTPTPTETLTGTPPTSTPRSPQLIATLENGNQWELDYSINTGQIALFIIGLILVAFLIFLVSLKLIK